MNSGSLRWGFAVTPWTPLLLSKPSRPCPYRWPFLPLFYQSEHYFYIFRPPRPRIRVLHKLGACGGSGVEGAKRPGPWHLRAKLKNMACFEQGRQSEPFRANERVPPAPTCSPGGCWAEPLLRPSLLTLARHGGFAVESGLCFAIDVAPAFLPARESPEQTPHLI